MIGTKEISEVAVEINSIFDNMTFELLEKIPTEVKEFFREKASETYEFNYDKTKLLYEQELMPQTMGIISLLYKEYICNEEEKKSYMQEYRKFLYEQEQEKMKKYNPEDIFAKRNEKNEELQNLPVEIKEEKISWLKKLVNAIKRIFKKNS